MTADAPANASAPAEPISVSPPENETLSCAYDAVRNDSAIDAMLAACPTLDFTMKSRPRYLLMVFALAGDSTMTSDFPIDPLALCGHRICWGET